MKKKIWGVVLGCVAVVVGLLKASNVVYTTIANETALSYSQNYVVDMSSRDISRMSASVTLATATIPTSSFTDGTQSTFTVVVTTYPFLIESRSSGTITISSNSALNGGYASNTISITSNAALDGGYAVDYVSVSSNINVSSSALTINGLSFGTSVQYFMGASSAATTANLANAINSAFYDIRATTTGFSGSTITLSVTRIGSYANSYTVQSGSVPLMSVLYSSFSYGYDPVVLSLFNSVNNSTYVLTAGVQFTVGATSQTTTLSLAQAMANETEYSVEAATAGVQGSSITVYVSQVGSQYNSYALVSSSPTVLQVGNASFTGGADRVQFSINGMLFTSSVNFFTDVTASGTAVNISSMLATIPGLAAPVATSPVTSNPYNPYNYAPIITVSTAGTTGIINLTAVSTGSAYVYPLYTSSQTALGLSYKSVTISGSTTSAIQGGRDFSYLIANGKTLRQGLHWFAQTSNSDTAKSLSDALQSTTTGIGLFFMSTWSVNGSTGIITSTSIPVGTYYNIALVTSSQPALGLSGNVVFNATANVWISASLGGTNPGYSTTTDIISLPGNTFGLGIPVALSTSNGGPIGGLTTANTYYVIIVDSNSIKLATTNANAVAGTAIDLTSISTQTTAHNYTLTSIPPLGTVTGIWQVTNDTANWFNVGTGSTTLQSPYVSTSTFVDFGQTNERFRRFNVTVSTAGAYTVKVTINGKN